MSEGFFYVRGFLQGSPWTLGERPRRTRYAISREFMCHQGTLGLVGVTLVYSYASPRFRPVISSAEDASCFRSVTSITSGNALSGESVILYLTYPPREQFTQAACRAIPRGTVEVLYLYCIPRGSPTTSPPHSVPMTLREQEARSRRALQQRQLWFPCPLCQPPPSNLFVV